MNQIYGTTDAGLLREMGRIRTVANQIAFWSWCAMLFCIPFSTALGLLFTATAVISGLVGYSFQSFKTAIWQPAIALCIALFAWLTISMLWSVAPKAEMLEAWSKYRKLLYPALALMVLYNLRKSPRAMVFSFLAGTGLVALVSLASAYGLLQVLLGPPEVAGGWYVGPGWLFIGGPDNPTFGRNHITQSAFLAFASMLALGYAWRMAASGGRMASVLIWSSLATLLLQPIFLLQSRTGYLLVAALIVFWAYVVISHVPSRRWASVLLPGGAVFALMIATSPHILPRTSLMANSIQQYVEKKAPIDSGVRLEFWTAGLEIFSNRPYGGVGVGGYAEAYSLLGVGPDWLRKSRPQPHSEIVLMAVQGGLVALILFVAIFIACLWHVWKRKAFCPGSFGIILLFFLDAAVNSVIWDLAEGHLFLILVVAAILPINPLPPPSTKKRAPQV